MTLDPEGNLWFSNVTRYDASEEFAYACAATSVFRLVILYVEKRASLYNLNTHLICILWCESPPPALNLNQSS